MLGIEEVDVPGLIGDSSLTMHVFRSDEAVWIEEAVKTVEVTWTEEAYFMSL